MFIISIQKNNHFKQNLLTFIYNCCLGMLFENYFLILFLIYFIVFYLIVDVMEEIQFFFYHVKTLFIIEIQKL